MVTFKSDPFIKIDPFNIYNKFEIYLNKLVLMNDIDTILELQKIIIQRLKEFD